MAKEKLYIFDTTLRDGQQTQGVDFSVQDKIIISEALDNFGLDYSPGRITVSTAGVTPQILEAASEIKTCLALSLHAPNDEIREKIMPINKKYKIADLIASCSSYAKINNEKIFLEYVLLKNINDSESCAKELIKLMGKLPCKLNLIEFSND